MMKTPLLASVFLLTTLGVFGAVATNGTSVVVTTGTPSPGTTCTKESEKKVEKKEAPKKAEKKSEKKRDDDKWPAKRS